MDLEHLPFIVSVCATIIGMFIGSLVFVYKMNLAYTDKNISDLNKTIGERINTLDNTVEGKITSLKDHFETFKESQYMYTSDLKDELKELRREISDLRNDSHKQNQQIIDLLGKLVQNITIK